MSHIYQTPIANFWLESSGHPVPFTVRDMRNDYTKILAHIKLSRHKYNVDSIVVIEPQLQYLSRPCSNLTLKTSLTAADYTFDALETGENLFQEDFICTHKPFSLSVGLFALEDLNKPINTSILGNSDAKRLYPFAYEIDEHHTPDIGYIDMEERAVENCKFAIAVKWFSNHPVNNTDATDYAVFSII